MLGALGTRYPVIVPPSAQVKYVFGLFWERCDEARERDFQSQLGTGPKERANDNGHNLPVSKFGSLSYSLRYGEDTLTIWSGRKTPKLRVLVFTASIPKPGSPRKPQALRRRNNRAEFVVVDSPTWLSRNGARFALTRQHTSSHALGCHLWSQAKLNRSTRLECAGGSPLNA